MSELRRCHCGKPLIDFTPESGGSLVELSGTEIKCSGCGKRWEMSYDFFEDNFWPDWDEVKS